MSFPAYEEYKESGDSFLGDVPEHWNVTKLGFLCHKVGSGKTPKGGSETYVDDGVLFIRSQNVYDDGLRLDDVVYISEEVDEEMAISRVEQGDVLLNITGASLGRTCLVAGDIPSANVNQHVCIIRLKDERQREFVAMAMKAFLIKSQIDACQNGAAREGLNFEQIGQLRLALPSEGEQQAISSFLDMETSKIDGLVSEQRRLIELLKEKRQAVISHAVAKGLNPNAPMKPSGIQWLGDVPEHWTVSRLKYVKSLDTNSFVDGPFGSNLKSQHFVENGDVYVIESNFGTTGKIDTEKLKTITAEHFETVRRSETIGGDIIIAKIGARFGMSSILPTLDKPALVSGNSMKLTLNDEICDADFINWQLTNLKQLGAMDDIVNATAQPALSLGGMNGLPILLPGLVEQREIVHRLRQRLLQFDTLLAEAERAIELLQERRTAIISAAVTGKIDVREFATATLRYQDKAP